MNNDSSLRIRRKGGVLLSALVACVLALRMVALGRKVQSLTLFRPSLPMGDGAAHGFTHLKHAFCADSARAMEHLETSRSWSRLSEDELR